MREYHSSLLLSSPARPIVWLVEGLLPLGTIGDVSGPPGDGKSTVLLHLAACISTGANWFGHRTSRTPVAWITGEASGADALARDLQRLRLDPKTDILFLQPESEIFRFDRQLERWWTTDEGGRIFQRCHDAGSGFVVIDTLGSVCAGLAEVDNDQQRQLARHLRTAFAGVTMITISHTNQASAKDELSWRLHFLSRAGGNGFPGAVRWAGGVTKLQRQDAERLGGRVTAQEVEEAKLVAFGISKHNEMPRPTATNTSPMIFEIRQEGSLVLVADGEAVSLFQRASATARVADKGRKKPTTPLSSAAPAIIDGSYADVDF